MIALRDSLYDSEIRANKTPLPFLIAILRNQFNITIKGLFRSFSAAASRGSQCLVCLAPSDRSGSRRGKEATCRVDHAERNSTGKQRDEEPDALVFADGLAPSVSSATRTKLRLIPRPPRNWPEARSGK